MFEYLNEDQIITGIKRKEILYEKISKKHKKNIQIAKEAIAVNPENINYVPDDVITSHWDEIRNKTSKVDGLIPLSKALILFPEKINDDAFCYDWLTHNLKLRLEDSIKIKPLDTNIDFYLKVLTNNDSIYYFRHPLIAHFNSYLKKTNNTQLLEKILSINPEYASYIPLELVKNANFDFFMKLIINYKTKEVFQIVNSIFDNFKFPKESALKVYKEYLNAKEKSSVSINLQYLMLKMIPYIPKKERTKEMLLLALSDDDFFFDSEDFPQCVLEEMTIEDIKYLSERDASNANKYISTYKYHCDVNTIDEIKELAQIAIEATKLQKSKIFIKNIYNQVFFDSYGDSHDFMIDYKIPTNITADKALIFLSDFVAGRIQPEVNNEESLSKKKKK